MSYHAILRAKERYGIELDFEDIEAMLQSLRRRDPRAIDLGVRDRTGRDDAIVFGVRWPGADGRCHWVIGIRKNGRIVTFIERKHLCGKMQAALKARKKQLIADGVIPPDPVGTRAARRKRERARQAERRRARIAVQPHEQGGIDASH